MVKFSRKIKNINACQLQIIHSAFRIKSPLNMDNTHHGCFNFKILNLVFFCLNERECFSHRLKTLFKIKSILNVLLT